MEHARQTITDLEARLRELEREAGKIKTTINCLCEVIGDKPKYADAQTDTLSRSTRKDEYYGRPLATVVTEVLEKRRVAGEGAAPLDEIYEELLAGGFEFVGKNEAIKKRGLAISMSKNQKFLKLSNEAWGLTEWYPEAKKSKLLRENGKSENKIDQADPDEEGLENSTRQGQTQVTTQHRGIETTGNQNDGAQTQIVDDAPSENSS